MASLTLLWARNLACIIAALGFAVSACAAPAGAAEKRLDFNRDVRPILSDKCMHCHGPDEKHRETDFRLDDEQAAKADLGGYRAIVPGNVEKSLLVARIESNNADEQMPPPDSHKKLSSAERAVLRRWIAEGATFAAHWAYVRPVKHEPPPVNNSPWPLNSIDHFLWQRFTEEGVSPAPEADAITLGRRLHFDLLGLPPEPADVESLARLTDPVAYEALVDRLLASEHFGERMAIFWLDLVRFADTVGYHGDQDHNASPYRDYVIDAFNDNMPFDRFTREQLAGDLLPNAGNDQKIATCYNRLLQTSHEGGVQPKEYLTIYAADRVRNFSGAWLGGTMGCAQCHTHKFDPYTLRDFYSLAAFFADVDEAKHFTVGTNSLPTSRPPEEKLLTSRERARLAALDAEIAALMAGPQGESKAAAAEKGRKLAELQGRRKQMENSARAVMVTAAVDPRTMRILPRGNWLDDSGEVVEPAIPAFLGKLEVGQRRATRLDLAQWLCDGEKGIGGLTARVFANRVWALFFGAGLARNLDDFGGQGEPPLHPELLDHLALEFQDSGWNVKRLVKYIVLSRAYRQSAAASPATLERDPENRLCARQASFRLPAEMVRDAVLASSGLLVREIGGRSVRPYQPEGYYRHLNFPKRGYTADTDARQWRRGLYVHWQRQYVHPMLKAFDAPSREECTAQRARSNTPLAALALLNDPTVVEAARSLASLALREGGASENERLAFVFRRTTSRTPSETELEVLRELLAGSRARFQKQPLQAAALLQTGTAKVTAAGEPGEWAAWCEVARAALNLSESITRN